MTLIVQNGHVITKSGRLATNLGCCCSPCCCTGNLPPTSNNLSDYTGASLLRRILNPATSLCTGKGISPRLPKDLAGTGACDPLSVYVEWCGLGPGAPSERQEPFESFVHPVHGRLFKQAVFFTFIETSGFGLPSPRLNVCGRCVYRILLRTSVQTYPNPSTGIAYKEYFLDWREGCDADINVMLYEIKDLFSSPTAPNTTFALPYCDDPPVITFIFAP